METPKRSRSLLQSSIASGLSLLVFSSILTPYCCYAGPKTDPNSSPAAFQAAEILGIRPQVDRLLLLQREGDNSASRNEILFLRALILRKTLLGFLQVRRASNKTDLEITYANDVLNRERNKQAVVFQTLDLINFARLAVQFTVSSSERIHKQFKQSSELGTVGAGVGTAIPIFSLLYGKYYKCKIDVPKKLTDMLDGAPVDASGLPEYVDKFLESPEPGATKTRKEQMFEVWKKDFRVDPANKNTLCGIDDGKAKGLFLLSTRVTLLWSLRNYIQDFDHELLALSNLTKSPIAASSESTLASAGLSNFASEAARLLHVEAPVAELISLNRSQIDNDRRLELETGLLEKILTGLLDVRSATDKVDDELHYNYDIVLSGLLAKRGQALQKNFEVNFIQSGTLGSVAGYLFLKGYSKAAQDCFLVSGSVSTGLASLALWQNRGSKKAFSSDPNSLADFLDLQPSMYHFSPLISEFFSAPSPESKSGQSRKDYLNSLWQEKNKIATVNLDSAKHRAEVAGMPPAKYDTIKILRNRVALLQSLKANLEFFDEDLLQLLQQTNPESKSIATDDSQNPQLTRSAARAARLLAVRVDVAGPAGSIGSQSIDSNILKEKLSLTRKILEGSLDAHVAADKLDLEIVRETNVRDRMVRSRDFDVAMINNANFFQIGILGLINSGPLSLSPHPINKYDGNIVNSVEGYLVGGLAFTAYLRKNIGFRPQPASPNVLGQVLGLDPKFAASFSPFIWSFLNSPSPVGNSTKTERENLIDYWKETKAITVNPGNQAAAERVAASGSAHHWWNESIKLINTRIRMMYGLQGLIELLDVGLSELLQSID